MSANKAIWYKAHVDWSPKIGVLIRRDGSKWIIYADGCMSPFYEPGE